MDRSPSQVVLDERRGFQRDASGAIVVRRFFGSDIIATVISFVATAVYLMILVVLLTWFLDLLPEGTNAVRVGG